MARVLRFFSLLTAYRYCTCAKDGVYRREFGQYDGAQSAVSRHRSTLNAVVENCRAEPQLPVNALNRLLFLTQLFNKKCDVISSGVPLSQRFATILLPTLIFEFLAIFVPLRIESWGFLAAGLGTLAFTLMIAVSLVVLFPPADLTLALDHATSRLLSALPALLGFSLTLAPDSGYLRSNRYYRAGLVVLQVLTLVVLTYHKAFFERLELNDIRHDLPLPVRRHMARYALLLLASDKAFREDADNRAKRNDITDHMVIAVTLLKADSYNFIWTLIVLSGVRVRRRGYALAPKLILVPLAATIGGVNVYAYHTEPLAFTDKLGWAIMATLVMTSFAILPYYSLSAATVQCTKWIAGTAVNTLLVTVPVIATQNRVLQSSWTFGLLAGGNCAVLLLASHHVSGAFGWVALFVAKLLSGTDPDTESHEYYLSLVQQLRDFADGGGEADNAPADIEPRPLYIGPASESEDR
ncbi:hypothetical protein [Mesorhizobium sp. GbtcB19]|uniref:hypothetical protein n=1 Tax=Mesorhizobium sp. GbtcB19 TaxID=2824764 RepID=UPI001C2FEEFD|nr:hypothetical protein [Mesorhizobium sp. GbtcB19]